MQDENFNETLSLTDEETPLPEGWRLVRLGDICYRSRRIVEPQSDEARKLKYLSLEHIESETGKILFNPTEVLEDEGKSTTFYFNENHVLYGKLRPYLNKVSLPDFEGRCTTEIIPLLPNENATREYLALILRRVETVNAVMKETTGSRMPRADMDVLLNLKIPLPSTIEEQRRIAAILDEQMEAVEAARFVVEEQLAAARLLPNAFLRSVFESEDAQNWQKRKLGDVCDVVTGGTPPRSEAKFYGGSIAWIKPDDLDKSIYVEKSAEYLTEEGGKISRLLPEGSVLVSCIGNIGKLAIAGKTLATNQQINSLIPSKEVDSLYLYYTCKFMKPVFNSEASISLVSILNKSGFSNIEIPLPIKNEQTKVAERLNEQMQAVETLKQSVSEKLEAVKKLPTALLRKAFAGEI